MISIEPLGDESEAQRMEAMAGRGGGRNARTVHAIRCCNAQVQGNYPSIPVVGAVVLHDESS